MKTIEVVAAIIYDHQGHILATQRGYGDMKNGWEFPGGKIEKGESCEEALHREIYEELEVTISIEHKIKTIEWNYPQYHLILHCFWCHIQTGTIVLKEHKDSKWLGIEELYSVDWLPADIGIIYDIRQKMQKIDF